MHTIFNQPRWFNIGRKVAFNKAFTIQILDSFTLIRLKHNQAQTPEEESISARNAYKHEIKEPTVTTAEALAHATKHYTQEINRAYSDMEKMLMARISESNQRRFRVVLLSVTLVVFWIIAVFGRHIRKMLSDQTAGLAKETLENESLKIQTQELATAVVQTILNDKEVTAHAATFLREASSDPETQEALLKLTLHVLQHQKSLDELLILIRKLLAHLATDQVICQPIYD